MTLTAKEPQVVAERMDPPDDYDEGIDRRSRTALAVLQRYRDMKDRVTHSISCVIPIMFSRGVERQLDLILDECVRLGVPQEDLYVRLELVVRAPRDLEEGDAR